MTFRIFRVPRRASVQSVCPAFTGFAGCQGGSSMSGKRKTWSFSPGRCPSAHTCVLPVVVACIFLFTVSQLIVIHRTIKAYKSRNEAYEECYNGKSNWNAKANETNSKILVDLAFSKKFVPTWTNSSTGWADQARSPYPLKLPVRLSLDHSWSTLCPETPPGLRGDISFDNQGEVSFEEVLMQNRDVDVGGKWAPQDCRSRFHVALIIPYRQRWNHLVSLLHVLHPMLQRQQLTYQIFVVEQAGNYTFNKGAVMNSGFLLAMNTSAFDCVIFHDVDLLPQDDRNLYNCDVQAVRHLSVGIDSLRYRLPYVSLVGGVFAVTVDQFLLVNGYSNLYWGWGGEDDDMSKRLKATSLKITRPIGNVARYKMLPHGPRLRNRFMEPLIRSAPVRYTKDGLTSSRFRVISVLVKPLFTHFVIDVGQPSYIVRMTLPAIPSDTGGPSLPSPSSDKVGH